MLSCGPQTVPLPAMVGRKVSLDALEALADLDLGETNALAFEWTWTSRPQASVAGFSDAAALVPTVTPDVPGRYEARLTVRDGAGTPLGEIDVVTGTDALPPVAVPTLRGLPGEAESVVLDALSSFDTDGDALSYAWSVEAAPEGSVAAPADTAAAPLSGFAFDVPGEYVLGLTVTDARGEASATACLPVTYEEEASRREFRTAYDDTLPNDGAAVVTFDLGDVSAGSGVDRVIPSFDVDRGGESTFDVLTFTFRGTLYELRSGRDILEFVAFIEHDGDGMTDARISPETDVRDLTLVFGADAGSATLQNVIGSGLPRNGLLARSADFYEGGTRRLAPPEAALRFEARRAADLVTFDARRSTDIDGGPLGAAIEIVAGPGGADVTPGNLGDATLAAPAAGDYLARATVSDGAASDAAYALLRAGDAGNLRPVARIASEAAASVGAAVTFDGSQSYDFDGDVLSHAWAILSAPAGSAATLAGADGPFAELTPDAAGLYVVQLVARDGQDASRPVTLALDVPAGLPRADAGADLMRSATGDTVLDGAVQPAGAQPAWSVLGLTATSENAALTGADTLSPRVAFDGAAGAAVLQLIAEDGALPSRPDTVLVASGDLRPDARRGAEIAGASGTEVTFAAADYVTDADGDALTFGWSLIGRPAASALDLGAPIVAGETLSLTPDAAGLYLVQLMARDERHDADPVVIVLRVENGAPVAEIAPPAEAGVGETVTLDARGSSDPDRDALTYAWRLVSAPAGSAAAFSDASAVMPTLVPDLPGTYAVELTVSDGALDSAPASAALTVRNAAPEVLLVGPAKAVVGAEAVFDASGSSDPDGGTLTYVFTLAERPAGSSAQLVDLDEGRTGLVPDVAGDYRVTVAVSDGIDTAEADAVLAAAASNAPPVLGPLLPAYTVELGLKLALDVAATDPDGDPLTFTLSPLPLVDGATFEAGSGALRFRPEAGQEGTYPVTVTVSDGVFTDEASFDVVVIPATAGETAIRGRVLDAVEFANGVETPLAGMPVRLETAALEVLTDAEGRFRFGGLATQTDRVEVLPSAANGPGGYAAAARLVRITPNQDRDVDPDLLLVPLGDGCATPVAGEDTVVASAVSGLEVTIPAGSIEDAAGAAYTGEICLGSLPDLFAAPEMPAENLACRIYALDAPGAVFTSPVAIRAPNLDALPGGASVDLWRLPSGGLQFARAAAGGVDDGGSTVSASLTRLQDGSLLTFLPRAPRSVPAGDVATGVKSLSVFEGDLSETYALPGYRAFDETQQVALSYHSLAADPTVIVAGDVTVAADASLPETLRTRIDIGGLRLEQSDVWDPRQGADGSTPALVGEAVTLRQSMPVDAAGLPSGRYAYDFTAAAQYACSTVGARHAGVLDVHNETESPFGRGWSVDGLQTLTPGPGGSVVIQDDDGTTQFRPQPTLTEFEAEPLVFPAVGTNGVVTADMDGDGRLDVVFGENGTGEIKVIRNLGDRDFAAQPGTVVGDADDVPQTGRYFPNLLTVEVGDLGSGEEADLAYALQLERKLRILQNDGFGALTSQGGYDFTGIRPTDLVVTDLDDDGYDDVVLLAGATNAFLRRTRVYVDFGGPDGRDIVEIADSIGQSPLQVVVEDLDDDGRKDVAVRTESGISLVFNEGNRNFSRVSVNDLGGAPSTTLDEFMRFADFDGDDLPEIVWSERDKLVVYKNQGGRSFNAPVALPRPPSADGAEQIAIADANADGSPDITMTAGDEVHVYLSNGDGTFQPFESGFLDYPINSQVTADLDGDGSLDLVSISRFAVRIHFSKPSATGTFRPAEGEFSALNKLPGGGWARRYTDGMVVEFDADGRQVAEVDPEGNRRAFAYDVDGRLETVTDQVGGVTTFAYGALGRLDTVTDPSGRVTTTTYDDAAGTLAGIEEPGGATVGFAYDENGRLISTTNQNGNGTTYSYDGAGKLSGATMADGSTIAMQVAATLGLPDGLGGAGSGPLRYVPPADRVTTVTDRRGEVSEVEVNRFGAAVRVTDPLGRTTRIERDDLNLVRRVERPGLEPGDPVRVDEMDYDALGNVTRLTEAVGTPEERTTLYEYEPEFSRMVAMTDPDGFRTQYEHDEFGNVIRVIDAEGNVTELPRLGNGKIETTTDELGRQTVRTYDARQNLTRVVHPDGTIEEMTYDLVGNVVEERHAVGLPEERRVLRTFDALSRLTSVEVTGPDGAQIGGVTTYAYDAAGNLAAMTDETGLVTRYAYDEMERLVEVEDPAEGTIRRTYDAAGEIVEHVDGAGSVHRYAYDEVGRMTEVTDPEGFVKRFAYDDRDNVTAVTDGRGGTTVFGYDDLDRMVIRTDPLGLSIERGYDARGNLDVLIREDGSIEFATYDGLGRRVEVATPDNTMRYAYDAVGNLTEAADDDSRVTFAFDDRDRLVSTTTDGTVGPQPEVTLTYAYDALGRRVSMSDSLGGTTTYAYDPESRLTRMTAPWGTAFDFSYDDEGRRTRLTSSTGRDTAYGYTNGLLSSLTHLQGGVPLADLGYRYGADGKLTEIVDALAPERSRRLSYDALDRLIMVEEGVLTADVDGGAMPLPVEDYAYDEEGNRLASHLSALHLSNAHNQLTEDDDYTYAYDARGNRVSRTAKADGSVETYGYDSQNRLVSYEGADGTVAAYAYDALDRRIAKTVDGWTEAYLHDPWSLAATANDVVLDFEGAEGTVPDLAVRRAFGPRVDEPLAEERHAPGSTAPGTGSVRALVASRLGSLLLAVNVATGTVAAEAEYDSFGQRTLVSGTQSELPRHGYTGREHDIESGLVHYRARAYDPATGSFLQRDPIGFAAGDPNLYAYVWNDPYNWTDPSGLSAATVSRTILAARLARMPRSVVSLVSAALSAAIVDTLADLLNKPSLNEDPSGKDGDDSSGKDGDEDSGGDGSNQDPGNEPPDPKRDIANDIAFGHGQAHLDEFEDLGVETTEDLAGLVEETMRGPTHSGQLSNGREYYYNEYNNTLVVVDPNHPDGGTVFSPDNGMDYVESLR